jgi:hypothetical protein
MAAAQTWAARVVTNGGSAPSTSTIRSIAFFFDDIFAANLQSKFYFLNIFAPDNLTAAITPLIATVGNNPWTNSGFVAGDLNEYGLKGNGSSKLLDTGLIPQSHLTYTNMTIVGMADDVPVHHGLIAGEYITSSAIQIFGSSPTTAPDWQNSVMADIPYQGGVTDRVIARMYRNGYFCATHTGGRIKLWIGHPIWYSHFQAQDSAHVGNNPANLTYGLTVFCRRTGPSSYDSYWAGRLQMIGVATGFTEADSLALYNAIVALRQRFAGVTHTRGQNWARRVVANGGAAPSTATINAIDTFLNTLESAGLLSKIDTMCVFVPDNFIAASTPVWRRWGDDPWTNVGFGDGDISIKGITGKLNCRLNTGLDHIYGLRQGINTSFVMYLSEVTGNSCLSGHGTTAYQFILNTGTPNNTFIWDSPYPAGRILVTDSRVKAGFWHGVRSATNSSKLYHARSDLAHVELGSSSSTVTALTSTFIMPCVGRNDSELLRGSLSVAAYCQALNATESEVFYNAMQTLRQTLGGGYV